MPHDREQPIPVVLRDDSDLDYDQPRIVVNVTSYFLGDDARQAREAMLRRLRAFLVEMPPLHAERTEDAT